MRRRGPRPRNATQTPGGGADQPEPAEQGEDGADVKHAGALIEQEPLPRGLLAAARAAGNSHHNLRGTP